MKPIRSSTLTISLIALFTLTAGGCKAEQGGNAAPMSSIPPATSAPPTDSAGDFGTLKACDLLDKALQGKGFSPVEAETYGGPNGCRSGKSLYADIGLNLQVGAPYDQLVTESDKLHRGEVHGRRAIQVRNGIGANGSCAIAMEVGPKSRAFLSASMATGTTDEACSFVTSIAENIEPMLPKVR